MNKPSQFVFLPTDKLSQITVRLKTGEMMYTYKIFNNESVGDVKINQNHDLYILSDDEIKEGDWVIVGGKGVRKVNTNDTQDPTKWIVIGESNAVLRTACKKIIATTNPELLDKLIESSHFDSFTSKSDIAPIDSVTKREDNLTDLEYMISLYNGKGTEVVSDILPKNVEKYISTANEWEKVMLRNFYKWMQNNQCLQDNADKKFTLEDMIKCWDAGRARALEGSHGTKRYTTLDFEPFIESLAKEQPKSDTVMVEYELNKWSESNEPIGKRSSYKPKLKDGNICIIR